MAQLLQVVPPDVLVKLPAGHLVQLNELVESFSPAAQTCGQLGKPESPPFFSA